tara:strand:- start:1498 stop:1773 length:276 start_codon:yes stop_codon:yes gene_type:complete
MVWGEYLYDAVPNDITDSDTDDDINFNRRSILTYNEWITWYSNDLMNMWSTINNYVDAVGMTDHILNMSDYDDFCQFCYYKSSKLPSRLPS